MTQTVPGSSTRNTAVAPHVDSATISGGHLVAKALKAEGVDKLVEVGAGNVLTGLAKRISPDFALGAVHTTADVEAFFKSL